MASIKHETDVKFDTEWTYEGDLPEAPSVVPGQHFESTRAVPSPLSGQSANYQSTRGIETKSTENP